MTCDINFIPTIRSFVEIIPRGKKRKEKKKNKKENEIKKRGERMNRELKAHLRTFRAVKMENLPTCEY